jgi:uncharacterized phage protein (TIGR02218 family)
LSRSLSVGMQAHLATRMHTRATMMLFQLEDGTAVGITDHNKDIDFNLTDAAGVGEITYQASTGVRRSDISMSASLDADNFEVEGPIGTLVTREAILGGRWNRARVWLFEVNWASTIDGAIKLLAGNVTDARLDGGRFIFEIRSDFDKYNQVVGRVMSNMCDADFADGIRCHATPTEVLGTVTAVTDATSFTVSFTGSYADDFFNGGTVEFLTGDLTGTRKIEIFDWTAGGVLSLFIAAAEAPAIGDTLTIRNGCMKSRAACMAHGQILNFRGFPDITGSDQIFRATLPGNP